MSDVQRPFLRRRDGHHARVTNEELLFDLVYAFAVTQLSHELLEHLTFGGLLETVILWFAVWLGWQYTCWFTNWFDPETPLIRTVLFVSMLLALILAAAIPDAFGERGLIFAAAGSCDIRSNALVARRARQWATHHRLPCVTAFATGSGPSTAEAIRTLRGQGRRHIAVGSWFLAPGLHYTRQAKLALDAGAVAVSAPMGGEPEIAEVALIRYVIAAMDLVDLHELEAGDREPAPVRHLSVVGA